MSPQRPDKLDQELDALFASYREACVVPEASANFVPELWEKLEGRRKWQLDWSRWAQGFVTLAAAASLAIAVLQAWPVKQFPANTYVEVLSAEHSPDRMPFVDVAFVDQRVREGQEGSPSR